MDGIDNAVATLGAALARIGEHAWPMQPERPGGQLLDAAGRLPHSLEAVAPMVTSGLRNTATPTSIDAPSAPNVVPASARAVVDGRFVPGGERDLLDAVRRLAGPLVEVRTLDRADALQAPSDGPLLDAIGDVLRAEDAGAVVVPFCLSAGTDNASFAPLGIPGYGFTPLRLPPGFPVAALFHGVDERIPVDALRFGARVLRRLVLDGRAATPSDR